MPADGDLRVMQRAVVRPDGPRLLLGWLARRLDAHVVLLDHRGRPVPGSGEPPADMLREAADGIDRVVGGRSRSAVIGTPVWTIRLVAVQDADPGRVLVVGAGAPLAAEAGALIADAARLLGLRQRLDRADDRMRAVERATRQVREAVLHLLMTGDVDGARRVAGALGPPLPATLRVYVVEGAAAVRDEIAARCEAADGGRGWVVRCPVYRRHLIVLAPADEAWEDEVERSLAVRDAYVGAGEVVALSQTGDGYEQAFHALAVARHRPDRFARFSRTADLAGLLDPAGCGWARRVLAPLLDYTPRRAQDPDGRELIGTLRSWLDFQAGAARQLKIHRNTLAGRIRHVQALLGRDLEQLGVQAELHLAVRLWHLRPQSQTAESVSKLDELLDTPLARRWARALLSPLQPHDTLLATLRAWLAADARLEVTAARLGISVPGARKRLVRVEQLIGRSVLTGPSARYDLLLALRIDDRPGRPD